MRRGARPRAPASAARRRCPSRVRGRGLPRRSPSTWSLALQQVASLDVGVRDRNDATVGGDRHGILGGADELPREALVPAVLLAGTHACAPSDVAAEVV